MDKPHVPYPGCYCADCVEGTKPIGYINAEMLNRKIEFEANGMVMFDRPCGEATMPLYAETPSERITGDKDRSFQSRALTPSMDNAQVTQRDREAAADLYLALDGGSVDPSDIAYANTVRQGRCDDSAAVQAFARHRLEPVGWMGIESAPKDGTFIDLWLDANGEKPARRVVDCFWDKKAGHWRRKGSPFHFGQFAFPQTPLAWMPLPSAPGTTPPEPVAEIERLREAAKALVAALESDKHYFGEEYNALRAALGDAS